MHIIYGGLHAYILLCILAQANFSSFLTVSSVAVEVISAVRLFPCFNGLCKFYKSPLNTNESVDPSGININLYSPTSGSKQKHTNI